MSEIELKIKSRDIGTLIATIKANNPAAGLDLVMKAYELAEAAHRGQVRLSGEPFIIHPLEVAITLAALKLDTDTIVAALLHDTVEDTTITLEKLKRDFNENIALLVDGVTKISSLKKKSKHTEQAQNLRKMLMATVKDVRVILIKLADKLHNMRTIMFQPPAKQRQVAAEVLDIYAPLAGRLGISAVRSELEDLAFHVLNHEDYHEIKEMVAHRKHEIEEFITGIQTVLKQKLAELDIDADITGRAKHYYSIYRKIKLQKKSFDEIFDIRAIRIITDKIKDCYSVLGIIHTLWTPITARFKDYIAVPKSNLYQSLHTTVMGPGGHPLEVQIRTREMHAVAEMGIAAHWIYKESGRKKDYRNPTILKNINMWESEEKNTREFMKELKMDLYEEEIFVFTPQGKIITLATGATPVDFAYAIHTEVGNTTSGARVNNVLVPLKSELKSGDIVEILTSKKAHPSEAWLKFVKSSNARYKIRNWLRQQSESQKKAEHAAHDEHRRKKTAEVSIPEPELIKVKKLSGHSKAVLSVDGTSNVMIRLSQCCQPIPGDDVIGFITRGRGITIHRKTCPSLARLRLEKERFISIVWEDSETTYPVKLSVTAFDRPNLLKDLAEEIGLAKANILKAEAQVIEKGSARFKCTLEVKSLAHLQDIIARIKKIKNVTSVYKVNEKVVIK